MNRFIICSIFSAILIVTVSGLSHETIVACSIYDEHFDGEDTLKAAISVQQTDFHIDNINLTLCTHLIYINSRHRQFIKPWTLDDDFNAEYYKHFQILRQKYDHLKIILGLGITPYEHMEMALSSHEQRKFIETALNFTLLYDFDGIDMELSYINEVAFDNEKSVTFVAKLKQHFEAHNHLIMWSFRQRIGQGEPHDFVRISKHLDFMIIYPEYVEKFIEIGVPLQKLVVKLEFLGGDRKSFYEKPILTYNDICVLLSNDTLKCVKHWDADRQTVQLKCDKEFQLNNVEFPNGRSIANEMRAIVRRGLAGALAHLNYDDYHGNCGIDADTFDDFNRIEGITLNFLQQNHVKFPLLTTMYEASIIAAHEIDNE